MLYQWLHDLANSYSFLNVFKYITFRAFISFFSAFFTGWIVGPYFIQHLKNRQLGQAVRDDGPKSHLKKAGTPTMGGGLILLSLALPLLLWINLSNWLVWGAIIITVGFGLVGYWDDYLKVSKKNAKDLPGKFRLS